MKIKKGDTVMVIAGKNRGVSGKVELVLVKKSEAIELWAKTNFNLKSMKSEKMENSSSAYGSGFAQGATLKLIQPKKLK